MSLVIPVEEFDNFRLMRDAKADSIPLHGGDRQLKGFQVVQNRPKYG
jgi:hypothetical protein